MQWYVSYSKSGDEWGPFSDEDRERIATASTVELHWRQAFGVPYAASYVESRGDGERGVLVRKCPVCGETIAEDTDAVGETTTNQYADHYVETHIHPPSELPR